MRLIRKEGSCIGPLSAEDIIALAMYGLRVVIESEESCKVPRSEGRTFVSYLSEVK